MHLLAVVGLRSVFLQAVLAGGNSQHLKGICSLPADAPCRPSVIMTADFKASKGSLFRPSYIMYRNHGNGILSHLPYSVSWKQGTGSAKIQGKRIIQGHDSLVRIIRVCWPHLVTVFFNTKGHSWISGACYSAILASYLCPVLWLTCMEVYPGQATG